MTVSVVLAVSELVRKLLLEMDQELLEHLEQHDLGDLIFCHR